MPTPASSTRPAAAAWRRFTRNRAAVAGLALVVFFLLMAAVGPWVAPHDPLKQHLDGALAAPSWSHGLGRDELGRDILSRILCGARISLGMALGASIIAAGVGVIVGLAAAYRGGAPEEILMRGVDIILAFPGFLLAIAVVSALGPSIVNLMVAVGINTIPGFARVTHSAAHAIKETEHVAAARALGNSGPRILWRHILPNCLAPIVVQFTLRMGTVVVIGSGLSFLGLGAQPPSPELGAMLGAGRQYLRVAPQVVAVPALGIFVGVLAFNFLGDALRDHLDPILGRAA